jgi:4-hydroxybenzoate polyprenyltransferase
LHLGPIFFVLLASAGFVAMAYGGAPPADRLGIFLFVMLVTQVAISLHNHFCDRELDAETKPWRAVPARVVSPSTLRTAAWRLFALGVAVSWSLGPLTPPLIVVGTGAGFVYNAWLKRTAFSWVPHWVALPTLPVAAFTVAERFDVSLLMGYVLGLPLVLAVNIADSLPDIEGDRSQGIRGLGQVLGMRRALIACWVGVGLAGVLVALTGLGQASSKGLLALSALLLCTSLPVGWRAPASGLHRVLVLASATALGFAWVVNMADRVGP